MRTWMLVCVALAMVWLVPAAVRAEGEEREARGDRAEAIEREVRQINAKIGEVERELAALRQREEPPRERIEKVSRQLNDLRAERARLLAGVHQRGEEGERREGREHAEQVERQVRELNQVLERRTAHLREMATSYGEEDKRVQAEKREIAAIRARRDALMRKVRAVERPDRAGPPKDRPRPERERPEAERERPRPRPDVPRPAEGDVERVLHALREAGQQERANELMALRKRQPDRFHQELREAAEWLRHMGEMRERDPEGFELHQQAMRMERESHGLAETVRRAKGDQREELMGRLRKHLSGLFDLKMRIRGREIERLERELKQMNERLAQRKKARERIVENRLRQLVGQEGEWEW